MPKTVKFKKLHEDAFIPEYAHETDSGFDFRTYFDFSISPDELVTIPTGLAIELPIYKDSFYDLELQVRPKSGLASKKGVVAVLGTIDLGYRGEIFVILKNMSVSPTPVDFKQGDKIAQGVVCPVFCGRRIEMEVVESLTETDRGEGGLGSTGA